jgi:tRNA (guanine26-N2/guanine27-N2)-dimethyltransferase
MYVEGSARIRYADGAFLNPAARVSRDISTAVVKYLVATEGERVLLDSTTATGVRAIRYSKEAGIKKLKCLDINGTAYGVAKKNLSFNKVTAKVINTGIQEFANSTDERFDIIDLDPFGSPAPNIFDIMKICRDGTTLFVTATDTGVLAGAHSKACLKVYDSTPMHNELCNEVGLRILAGYVARVAAQFNFGAFPILYLRHRNHMRVFMKMRHGSQQVAESLGIVGYAYYCRACYRRFCTPGAIPSEIDCNCGKRLYIAGKLWCGKMKDQKTADFVSACVGDMPNAQNESRKAAERLRDELDIPLYYHIPTLTKNWGLGSMRLSDIRDSLEKRGYSSSRMQVDEDGIKTGADIEIIDRVMHVIANKARRDRKRQL